MIVYIAINKENGKIYVGQTTISLKKRQSQHTSEAKRGSSIYFHNALRKYGKDNFTWEVLRICDNIESLNAFEQYFILYYNSMNRTLGYNNTSGGEGCVVSLSTRIKISETHKRIGTKPPSRKNCIVSDITREKMRQNGLGRKHSEKTKKLVSKNNARYWLDKKHSESTKKKMSKAKSGKNHHNYGKRGKGMPNYGRKMSDETKEKIRISQKRYYALKANANSITGTPTGFDSGTKSAVSTQIGTKPQSELFKGNIA